MLCLMRCRREAQLGGIRLEHIGEAWQATWSFPASEGTAGREGYGHTTLRGEVMTAPGYRGCYHCRAPLFVLCTCGRLTCWTGESSTHTCVWCGQTSEVSGTITELHASADL